MKFRQHWLGGLIAAALLLVPPLARAGETVPFNGGGYRPGTIVILTNERQLYYVLGNGRAIRYPVGVGKASHAWHGRAS